MIQQQLHQTLSEIADAAKRHGRASDTVRLVAVSKTHPVSAVQTAYDAGQRLFGENRVQELESKVPHLPFDIEWHLIGHLQSNKVAKAVSLAQWIHSVDSIALVERIERIAAEQGKHPNILLQVNISGEGSKEGLAVEDVRDAVTAALRCKHLSLKGFMTIAPFDIKSSELRRIFRDLRELRDTVAAEFRVELPELSMGMSGDFEEAIAEGATLVRIGSAIFGLRE